MLTSIKCNVILYGMLEQLELLSEKKRRLDHFRPLPAALVKNLEEWFKVELTYTSNAIEGNTLTRIETALIVEKGLTVQGKSLQEHLEATNHAQALDFIKGLVSAHRSQISEQTILQIHREILKNIDNLNAGKYRQVEVRIAGVDAKLPKFDKVPELVDEYIKWLHKSGADHPVKIAADAHFKLVAIHPFVDGNGRTARLLMNLLLMEEGYPPSLIRKEDRRYYIDSIHKMELGDPADFYQTIFDGVNRSLDIYLEALEPKSRSPKSSKNQLLKIGELASQSGETIPTIRHWINEGLLAAVNKTPSGYLLFDESMTEKVKRIRDLQNSRRLTLEEIKHELLGK